MTLMSCTRKKDKYVLYKKFFKKNKKMSSDYKKYPLTINEVSSDFDFFFSVRKNNIINS